MSAIRGAIRGASANGTTGMHWIRDTTRRRIYKRDGYRCVYCGAAAGTETDVKLTLDHLVPRCLGGTNHPSNLVTCCHRDNSDRQHLSLRAWFKKLRSRGVDTRKVGRRIRRLIKRPLPGA